MRRLKISLKKYFYFTFICALLLIFGFNLREHVILKFKHTDQLPVSQQQQEPCCKDDSANLIDDESNSAEIQQQKSQLQLQRLQVPISTVASNSVPIQGYYDGNANSDDELTQNDKLQQQQSQQQQQQKQQQPQQQAQEQQQDSYFQTQRPWYFKNGVSYPRPAVVAKSRNYKKYGAKLFPPQDVHSDRIINQLMYVPSNYEEIVSSGKMKVILLYNGYGPWNVKQGREVFLRSNCPVNTCELTSNRDRAQNADMILYKDHYIPTGIRRPVNSKQITMLYYLECPYHTQNVKMADAINWTATYRRDSDIVAPYEKWSYYNSKAHQIEQDRNYAINKTKKVAWFVSNCGARNGRLQFAQELQKYIDVDIYGACGTYKCSRVNADKCFDILDRDYKFYLAFENSNCKDYITEKFFVNALSRNILPIVMGARPEDYEVSAPHRSYIHVDEFASPKELAEYLNILDKDDELYNSYFKWKGTGEFINTYFWCRVCAALHDEDSLRRPRWYQDINEWWRGPGVCTNSSWRNLKARKDIIRDD